MTDSYKLSAIKTDPVNPVAKGFCIFAFFTSSYLSGTKI